MKILLCILAAAVLLSGCAGIAENNKRVEQLDQQMSAEWLKAHVIVGKTSKDEIALWYGKPLIVTSSASAGFGSGLMPDEIWTYSVHFSKTQNSWAGASSSRWTKSIAFSFKDGVVSNYNVTSVAF